MHEKLKDYIEQLLENVASECNIKEVILKIHGAQSVYSFDTMGDKTIGIDEDWPLYSFIFSGNIRDDMAKVRELVNIGLRQRAEAKIKVRQPLQSLTVNLGENHLKDN